MDPEAGHGERITVPDRLDPAAEGTELPATAVLARTWPREYLTAAGLRHVASQ
jgi:hypothetical protein